jgi:hypothetical protein
VLLDGCTLEDIENTEDTYPLIKLVKGKFDVNTSSMKRVRLSEYLPIHPIFKIRDSVVNLIKFDFKDFNSNFMHSINN